jgi:hypothetical protein
MPHTGSRLFRKTMACMFRKFLLVLRRLERIWNLPAAL